MAEIKKDAPKDERPWAIAFLPLIVGAFLLIILSRMEGKTILGEPIASPETDILANKKDVLNIYEWIGTGEIERGTRIINTKKVVVRNEPAGAAIGAQKKLDIGIVREGPVSARDVNWVRIDYAKAPDGWVLEHTVSSKINIVQGFNIFPIAYNFFKPIGYIALFIILTIYIYFRFQLKKEESITEKKLQLKRENAKEKEIPLAVRIAQKPDVQEIPGFQVEEIMPIEQLEKENRWQHIQDLIKSYNENDWRQAIIEADIILEEMLEKMQYDGITIGDKLKNVERSDFVTLDKAWSAHKVRNQIAHDGSNFKLTRDVAEKTIKDFEEVFREFYYI